MTLFEAIKRHAGKQAPALLRHLEGSGLTRWEDCTRSGLLNFRDDLTDRVAPSSARTYAAVFSAILGRYKDDQPITKDFADCLKIKGDKPRKTYLTDAEIARLEAVECHGEIEAFVLNEFLVGCRTGARLSDIERMTPENIQNGTLTYTSRKTHITSSMPCGEKTAERIAWLMAHRMRVSLAGYNDAIRRLCRRAGINAKVKVRRGGVERTGEKWEFISSHSARISLASNLYAKRLPMLDIAAICGHASSTMTERYVVNKGIHLNAAALAYFE